MAFGDTTSFAKHRIVTGGAFGHATLAMSLVLMLGMAWPGATAHVGTDKRHSRELPLRLHGKLLGRAAGRQGRPGMPEA